MEQPEPAPRPTGWLNRNVWTLGLVSLFNDTASEMLYPLVPLFVTGVLRAPMSIVGLIEGAAEATASVLKAYSGYLSDKWRRRRMLVFVGYVCAAVSKPLLAAALAWPMVLFSRLVDRFGKGVRTSARDALLADSSTPQTRGKVFGFHRALDTAGAVFGPLLALGLLHLFEGRLRPVFAVAFLPALLAALLVLRVEEKVPQQTAARPSFRLRAFRRDFRVFLFVSALFALGNSSDVFLIKRAQEVFAGGGPAGASPNMAPSILGLTVLAYMLYNAVYALASYPAGAVSDRLGQRNVFVGGLGVFAAVYLGFARAQQGWQVWMLFAIYGLYTALTEGVSKALAANLAGAEQRATALGLYHALIGGMTLLASTIAGLLWDIFSPAAAFGYGASLAVLAAILLVRLLPQKSVESPAG
jgi:MFS family permease